MWLSVVLVLTDVSEEHIASIFRVEKYASEEPTWAGACRLTCHSRWVFVSVNHGSRSSAPSRNLMLDLQGHAGPCTLSSIVPRPLDQCPFSSPSFFPPNTLLYRPWPATCSLISMTLSLPSPHYWFPMWPTLPRFLSSYCLLFSTDSSVCSPLFMLVPCLLIFLPWRWRW
jgi:hypothetical protein